MTRKELTLTGIVNQQLLCKGTKSEHTGYVLIADNGQKYRIRYVEENSFELKHTSMFLNKRVEIIGFLLDSMLFVYAQIKEII